MKGVGRDAAGGSGAAGCFAGEVNEEAVVFECSSEILAEISEGGVRFGESGTAVSAFLEVGFEFGGESGGFFDEPGDVTAIELLDECAGLVCVEATWDDEATVLGETVERSDFDG